MNTEKHLYDDIPRLLTGEADRDTVQAAPSHLRACADCTEELISAVVAHASLSSAARYAPDIVLVHEPTAADSDDDGEASSGADDSDSRQPARELSPLPDLSTMFAEIRAEAGSGSTAVAWRARRRRRPNVRLVAAAAVVGVGLAGGAGYYVADQLHGPDTRTVEVAAFGAGHTAATATVVGSKEIKLNAAALPPTTDGQYYEVWLTDAARHHMAPVGPLDADRKGDFTVSPALMETYSAIEVSVQDADGTGSYSGTSVLRGTYR